MPYITEEQRHLLEPELSALLKKVNTSRQFGLISESGMHGSLNYIITSLLLSAYAVKSGANYATFNALVGVLECAKLEMYRVHVGPYETKKMVDNGAV